MGGVSPIDFVMVRFASEPYRFMRRGHITIIPWLQHRGISFTQVQSTIYFELPDHLKRYEVVTRPLAEQLSFFAREVKRQLFVISLTSAKRYREHLTENELRLLYEFNIAVTL